VIVPKSAVRQEEGKDVVLVVQNDRVERRAVKISGTRDEQTLVSAGLAAGEKIVADWPAGLAEGAAVRERQQ